MYKTVRTVRKYAQEYKDQAVQLGLKSKTVNEAALSLGIPVGSLYAKAKASGMQAVADASGNINHVDVKNLIDENRELKKRLSRLEEEKAILKNGCDVLRSGIKVKYGFIMENQHAFSVLLMCKIFDVSRSVFYAWLTCKPGKRAQANLALDAKIKFIFEKHKQRYGALRVARELKKQNELCSHTRVANRMKAMSIQAVAKF